MVNKYGLITSLSASAAIVYYNGNFYNCKIKGKIKISNLHNQIVVGDYVQLEQINGEFVINDIIKRSSFIIRPKIANVNTVVVVQSIIEPNWNTKLLMKYLAYYETFIDDVIIVITKYDICTQKQKNEFASILNAFKSDKYKIYLINNDVEFSQFQLQLQNKLFCFAGNSGVGKSTLINKIMPNLNLRTQEISNALNRGKHTTTKTNIIVNGCYCLADTPGFSNIDIKLLTKLQFIHSYHDFRKISINCKYYDCTHTHENHCAIKNAVKSGEISTLRYQNYCEILKEFN